MSMELEHESESESKPIDDWYYKRIEDLEITDFSIYDDAIKPFQFVCDRFEYKNKAQIKLDEQIKVAMAEYKKNNQNLSYFDATSPPEIAESAGLIGGVRPLPITDDDRDRLIRLSKFALEIYNAQNQGANFEFDDLIKFTYCPGAIYYITFQAKQPSNNSATIIFQAHVKDNIIGLPKLGSCAIKT